MTAYKRVALFFAPKSGSPLAEFGANWLGWDVEHARDAPHPIIEGLPLEISQISETPRKYGFHGTLKAPFSLHEDKSLSELQDAVSEFTAKTNVFSIGQMKVARLGHFVAIIPVQQGDALKGFAANVVKEFDSFRAPLSDADIKKRRDKSQLTPHQDELMLTWGYPYIFDEFRFHLTLTGKLEDAHADAVEAILTAHLSDLLADPVDVVDLCLYVECENGRFEIIKRFPLRQ